MHSGQQKCAKRQALKCADRAFLLALSNQAKDVNVHIHYRV